jgi:hypothetical protein
MASCVVGKHPSALFGKSEQIGSFCSALAYASDAIRGAAVYGDRMSRAVPLRLGEFAVEALAGEEGGSMAQIRKRAVQAIRYYLADRGSQRPEWPVPRFLPTHDGARSVELELQMEEDLWHSLEEEAERQHVPAERLVDHAAFYFAADLDAGRVTLRILDESGD